MNDTEQKKLMKARGICVIIPTYNNAGTIRQVVTEALGQCDDVIVVDDGSTDGTSEILRSIEGITLVAYERNRGKGHALREGFRRALAMDFAYAVTLDADGQHYPADIAKFVAANRQHPGALIVGCRQMKGAVRTKGSIFANKFSNFWFYIQTGRHLTDTQTGYRLYPLRRLHGLSLLSARYEAELQLLVFASWHGTRLEPIDVDVYYPPIGERVSHFRPGKDFARIFALNTLLCFLAVVYGLPLRLWRALASFMRTAYSIAFFLFHSLFVFTPMVWFDFKLGKVTEKKRRRLHHLIYFASRFVMIHHGIPGTKFRYRLGDKVDFDKPRIIICNHQSHLDLMCQLVFTQNIVFLTNQRIYDNPFYGVLIRNAEYLAVRTGMDEILPHVRSLVERGYSVAVFPEGTRSLDCSIGRFHKGAFYLAQQLGLEIMPMCLYGAGKILPKHSRHLRKGTFYIEVGNPISQAELQAMGDLRQQAQEMRRRYKAKYEEISNEIEKDA